MEISKFGGNIAQCKVSPLKRNLAILVGVAEFRLIFLLWVGNRSESLQQVRTWAMFPIERNHSVDLSKPTDCRLHNGNIGLKLVNSNFSLLSSRFLCLLGAQTLYETVTKRSLFAKTCLVLFQVQYFLNLRSHQKTTAEE